LRRVFRYTLQASTFQMAVLLQYNDSDHWTVGQLLESTQIKKDILIQVPIFYRLSPSWLNFDTTIILITTLLISDFT
jgi:hypothetical protein